MPALYGVASALQKQGYKVTVDEVVHQGLTFPFVVPVFLCRFG